MTVHEPPVGSGALEAKAEEAVLQAVRHMQPTQMSGVVQGMLWLTPPAVQRVPEVRKGPHWLFTLTPMDKAVQVAPHDQGIYRAGVRFPPICPVCGKPATQVGLLETGLGMRTLSSKLRVATKADAQKVFQALRDRRVWYAVPLCAEHSLGSKGISMSDAPTSQAGTWKVTANIVDPDFGRAFGELNGLQGVWFHPTWLGAVKMHDPRDKDTLPGNWLLRVALVRLPLFVAAAAAFAFFVWTFIQQFRLSGGSLDLCSAGMIPAAIALVAAFALWFAGLMVGHFPKGGKRSS